MGELYFPKKAGRMRSIFSWESRSHGDKVTLIVNTKLWETKQRVVVKLEISRSPRVAKWISHKRFVRGSHGQEINIIWWLCLMRKSRGLGLVQRLTISIEWKGLFRLLILLFFSAQETASACMLKYSENIVTSAMCCFDWM